MPDLSVSVVIPTYNRAPLIARAIDSALAAIRSGDEIVVIDDGSTDHTCALIGRYGGAVRLVEAPHAGAGPTRNRGIAEAKNGLIAFLDSDDEWFPDKLELQRNVMRAHPHVMFCFSDFRVHDGAGRVYERYLAKWHQDPRSWDAILGPGTRYSTLAALAPSRQDFSVHVGDLYPALMARLYIGTFTLLVRKQIPHGVPRFPLDLPTFEDWQFFGELARRGAGAYLDCETAIQHGHHLPRLTHANALVQAQTRIKVLERVWGADAAYQARHGDAYRAVLEEQRRRVSFYGAKELLKAGRMREARAAFGRLDAYPLLDRLLLGFPGPIVRLLVKSLGWMRALRPGH